MFCIHDDWTAYRFVIYDSWVAFDATTQLASGPKPARLSAFDVTAALSRGPPFCAVLNQTGNAISRFYTAKTRRKKRFRKKYFHVEISISLSIDLANKQQICLMYFNKSVVAMEILKMLQLFGFTCQVLDFGKVKISIFSPVKKWMLYTTDMIPKIYG